MKYQSKIYMIQVLLGKLYKSRMKFCRVKLLRCVCVHTYARERKRPIEQLHTYTTVQNSRRTLNVPKTKPSPSGLQLTVIFTIDWSFCLFGPWNVKKLKRWTYNSKLTRQTGKSPVISPVIEYRIYMRWMSWPLLGDLFLLFLQV